jgi:uncharacterized iron-regulated membrane protein
MPPTLVVLLVGALLIYIGYLRIQIYIQRRIINAFQDAAVVVPPSKPKSDPRMGLFAIGMLLLALGVFASLVK